jgi:hypothetical protein
VSESDFISILLDINLYENPNLVSNAFNMLVRYFEQQKNITKLANEVQLLNESEEVEILNRCSAEIKIMKRDAEDADQWMGLKSKESLKKTRRFIDKLSAITALCVKA